MKLRFRSSDGVGVEVAAENSGGTEQESCLGEDTGAGADVKHSVTWS